LGILREHLIRRVAIPTLTDQEPSGPIYSVLPKNEEVWYAYSVGTPDRIGGSRVIGPNFLLRQKYTFWQ